MYEVAFEGFVLQCEITELVDVEPNPATWTSDWDAQGYRELELQFSVNTTASLPASYSGGPLASLSRSSTIPVRY